MTLSARSIPAPIGRLHLDLTPPPAMKHPLFHLNAVATDVISQSLHDQSQSSRQSFHTSARAGHPHHFRPPPPFQRRLTTGSRLICDVRPAGRPGGARALQPGADCSSFRPVTGPSPWYGSPARPRPPLPPSAVHSPLIG